MFSGARIVSRMGRRIKRGNERKWIFERTFPEEKKEEEEEEEEGNLSWRKGYEPWY